MALDDMNEPSVFNSLKTMAGFRRPPDDETRNRTCARRPQIAEIHNVITGMENSGSAGGYRSLALNRMSAPSFYAGATSAGGQRLRGNLDGRRSLHTFGIHLRLTTCLLEETSLSQRLFRWPAPDVGGYAGTPSPEFC